VHPRRVALAASTAAVISGALLAAVVVGGSACTHDRPPAEGTADVHIPDTNQEVTASTPPLAVLIDGVEQPANLTCNGKPRPDAGPLLPDAAGADTAVAETAVADAGDDASVEETGDTGAASTDAGASETASDASSSDASVPPGTLVDKDIELIAFGSGGTEKLPKQTVDVFYSNTLSGTPDVVGLVSDDKGMVRVKVPFGLRVGYHVRANELLSDFWALDDLHYPVPPVTVPRWQGITRAQQEFLAFAITGEKGYTMKPKTGIVSSRVADCDRRFVAYAKITLKDYTDDPAGKELTFGKCGQGLCLVYLGDTELPDVARTYTSRSSLFAMIDVPSDRKLGLIATGIAADGSVVQFARRAVEVREGAITFQYLEPSNELKF